MRICAFGTVRMDIHVYQDIDAIGNREEIKIDEMRMAIGGSVYNTASVLTELGQDVVLYIPCTGDDFADLIRVRLKRQRINYIEDARDVNDTSASLIFVAPSGAKKMVSYDGLRKDVHILEKLLKDAGQFDIFYTSFYEINRDNAAVICEIMDRCGKTFVDLSPLIYEAYPEVVRRILEQSPMLSGTQEEMEMLLHLLALPDPETLARTFAIPRLYVKMGSRGARVYVDGRAGELCEPPEKRLSHDTTGCGDTFNAGILCGLAGGQEDAQVLAGAVAMASRVAYEGLTPGMFRKKETK